LTYQKKINADIVLLRRLSCTTYQAVGGSAGLPKETLSNMELC